MKEGYTFQNLSLLAAGSEAVHGSNVGLDQMQAGSYRLPISEVRLAVISLTAIASRMIPKNLRIT